ncbi:MAG: 2-oxo acid dehydrogenase subunit E2 [Chloroflexi bacterium]|nr:2-oxo acid dehydrogenase subunit E2 [Chloroflexota bacterium]
MATQVKMPQLGESVVEGTVGQWLKRAGDRVMLYEPLVEVITDKVNTEIPSPAAGVVLALLVAEGETVRVGTPIAVVGEPGEQAPGSASSPVATAAPRAAVPAVAAAPAPVAAPRSRATYLSPVVARLVAEHSIDMSQLKGTGEEGRVTKRDVEAYLARAAVPATAPAPSVPPLAAVSPIPASAPVVREATPAPVPAPAAPTAGEDEFVPLSPMRRAIAENMLKSVQTAPHVTSVFEIDLSRVAAHYAANKDAFARQDADLTYTAYFVEVAARVLREQPQANSSFSMQGMLLHRAINIGIAVALEDGLIVPVLKNADELSLLGIARAVNDLARRARDKRLRPDDVQGGTFTITNPGRGGGLFGTPIIVQPQVAIMGVGAIAKRPIVIDDAIAIRLTANVGLTFDHRALDGADGDRFLAAVKRRLETYA